MSNTEVQQKLEIMLAMQDRINRRVHADWHEQGFAWYRALWLECGELVDHHGYKWWKKQVPDLAQVQLEVVDIWHFGLSMVLDGRPFENVASDLLDELAAAPPSSYPVLEAVELLAGIALVERRFDVAAFFALMTATGMSFAQLYEAYVSKNVLNVFRQDHGYQAGTYRKLWSGREDNAHLLDIIALLDSGRADFADLVYQGLAERYAVERTASE